MSHLSDDSAASGADATSSRELLSGGKRYRKARYAPPQPGFLYSVRDKTGAERIIRVTSVSRDGRRIEVLTLGTRSKRPIRLAVDALARQAASGWCSLLDPVDDNESASADIRSTPAANPVPSSTIRLDSQNFGRCCADIARANIRFSPQLIKDVGDGPFRAGDYQQAFIKFEQLAVAFTSAVSASRRAIADGRRALTAEKGNLSGKEIQERTTAFMRLEQQINAAERSFATILEGLRLYVITPTSDG